jgi:hypothetical protein
VTTTHRVRAALTLLVLAPVLALTAGCGQQVTGEAQPAAQVKTGKPSKATTKPSRSTRPSTPSRRPTSKPGSADLTALVGTWEGEYTCGQGETGLKLTIKEPEGDALPATFEFFPLPENPSAKAGSYTMRGRLSGDRMVFRQEKWIEQPPGYVMVDLEVTSPITEDATSLSGDVRSDNCKGFSVRRR